jgi:cytochrome c-type biogenesis protein CcmF
MTVMFGEPLLKISLILGGFFSLLLFLNVWKKLNVAKTYFIWLNRTLAGLLSISLLILFYSFYQPDFNINYVFSKVSMETPLIYRLSGLWIGQEGVFLVWAWALSITSLIFGEKRGLKYRFNREIVLFVNILTTFFIGLAIMMSPFETTLEALGKEVVRTGASFDSGSGLYEQGRGFIQGQGMNPILMSPWMALHPPIVFIAYALAAVPFGACLTYLIRREGDWEGISRQWARASWIFLSSSLIIGSFWAYEELSFGSYWTWDPIETASLIPWITLTIFLHGSYEYKRKGKFGLISPVFGVLTSILIVYGTFITKSGLVQSSHAYSKSAITPFLISIIILSIILLIAASLRFIFKDREREMNFTPIISTTNAFYLSAILLFLLLVVLMWGITYPLFTKLAADKTTVIGRSFYNENGYPFIAGLVLLSGFCLLLWVIKKDSALKAMLSVFTLGLIGYFLRPTGNKFLDAFIPICVFTILSVLIRLKKEIASPREKLLRIKNSSAHLLHLGITLLFLGVIASSSLQSGKDIIFSYPDEINTVKDAGEGYSVGLGNLLVFQDSMGNWVQRVNVTVHKNDKQQGDLTLSMVNNRRFGRRPEVTILRGFSSDLYVVYYGLSGGHEQGNFVLPINVKVNPFVSLLWLGSIIVVFSAGLILIIEEIYSNR